MTEDNEITIQSTMEVIQSTIGIPGPETIRALRDALGEPFAQSQFDILIGYQRTLEKEHRAMREAHETIRNAVPKVPLMETSHNEWGLAYDKGDWEAKKQMAQISTEVLSSLSYHE